jgi:hypothetical protein
MSNPALQNGRPVPDPTVLTTQQLERAISGLREILEARLNGMDKALSLTHEELNRRATEGSLKVSHLRELSDEKFSSIQTQFLERDTRTEQTSRDSKVAVDAALQAAKEAVGEQNKSSALAIAKSESATTKQIDQLVVLISTGTNAQDSKINDIKDRITTLESSNSTLASAQITQHDASSSRVAIIGVICTVGGLLIGVIFSVLMYFKH